MINFSNVGRAAVLVTAGALALGTAGAASATTDGSDQKAKDGTMDWGVKESFRDYIEGPIADGGIEVNKPAKRLRDGTFRWAKGKGNVDTEGDTAKLVMKGSVYFYGHDTGSGPTLEITIDKPRLVINGENSWMIADIASRVGGDLIQYDDVEFVTIDAAGLDLVEDGGKVSVSDLATVLTEAGAEAFGFFYEPGTEFDPLSFKVKL